MEELWKLEWFIPSRAQLEASSDPITPALVQFDPSPFFFHGVSKGVSFRVSNVEQWGQVPQGVPPSDVCSAAVEAITFHIIQHHTASFPGSSHPKSNPLEVHTGLAIPPHYPPSAPRALSKSNPTSGFAFAWGRNNPDFSPADSLHAPQESFPLYGMQKFWLGCASLLADPVVLTNQVAFAKCVSECLDVPPPIALSVIFNSPLYHLIFPGAGAW